MSQRGRLQLLIGGRHRSSARGTQSVHWYSRIWPTDNRDVTEVKTAGPLQIMPGRKARGFPGPPTQLHSVVMVIKSVQYHYVTLMWAHSFLFSLFFKPVSPSCFTQMASKETFLHSLWHLVLDGHSWKWNQGCCGNSASCGTNEVCWNEVYWSEVIPKYQQFTFMQCQHQFHTKRNIRQMEGYWFVPTVYSASKSVFTNPIHTLDTTVSSSLFVSAALLCLWIEW